MTWISDPALQRLRSAVEMPDLNGTRYQPVEKLGQGGMGAVYAVEDAVLGRRVALKVIGIAPTSSDLAWRLLHEARIIAQLEHPGIVPVHDAGTLPDGRAFYTMKLVKGVRLDKHITTLGNFADRLRLFEKICEAVSFAHAHGVLHRDLKPQNVMVGPFGEVLVMDWGLSKIVPQAPSNSGEVAPGDKETSGRGTAHGSILGTPGYMAPEQRHGEETDHRADVYSLGAILQFLGSGSSRIVMAIATKAMADEPAQRYSSVQELADDVAHYLNGLPVAAYPESWATRAGRWIGRNRAWILLVLAYLAMRSLFILWRGR